MFHIRNVARATALLGLAGLVYACNDDTQVVLGPRPTDANAIFARYASLGNSLPAGFQSNGINDSTQRRSFAVFLAQQMGTSFVYPSLAGRGCAPPLSNAQTGARVGTGSTAATCDLRTPNFSDLLNNVAVPGALVVDLTVAARSGTAITPNVQSPHIHASLFLGGKSQVEKALEIKPTFASIWIGNNDVLLPAGSGFLTPVPSVSLGITSVANFQTQYDAAITALLAGEPDLRGILIGVPNIINIPTFFPIDSLRTNATFRAQFEAGTGRVAASGDPFKAQALVIDPNCTTIQTSLLSMVIVGQINSFRNDTNPTGQPPKDPATRRGHPPHIACDAPSAFPSPIVGNIFVLNAAEQATLATTVAGYNSYLSTKASAINWAYMDPNVLLDSVRTAGGIPAKPILTSPTAPFGAWISLDGAHPTTQGHRAITNHVINAINAKYGTALVRISVP